MESRIVLLSNSLVFVFTSYITSNLKIGYKIEGKCQELSLKMLLKNISKVCTN